MNFVLSIIDPEYLDALFGICREMSLPVTLSMYGHGTATRTMLDLLGIDSGEKRVIINIASEEQTTELFRQEKRRLYIEAPGHGIAVAVPVKSVGGGKNLTMLSGGKYDFKPPALQFDYELIVAICSEGHTEEVMDAARAAGAGGGTVIHAKGSGSAYAERFLKVSLTNEREIVLIVVPKERKGSIMTSILKDCGPETEASTIVFTLPVIDAAGFQLTDKP